MRNRILTACLGFASPILTHAQFTGPSTLVSPYMLPSYPGAITRSLLTVGESVNNRPDGTAYRLVGKTDGMGVFPSGKSTFELLVNHELSASEGLLRAHGRAGSFVSRWRIRKDPQNPVVYRGNDQIVSTVLANGPSTLARFCSADLPAVSCFFDAASGLGTRNRYFMDGEENGQDSRCFAIGITGPDEGIALQLNSLGKFSHENEVASPFSGTNTIVLTTDDVAAGGELYCYIGAKRSAGTNLERAGLLGGNLYGIRVPGNLLENRAEGLTSNAFELVNLGNAASMTGSALQGISTTNQITQWLKPEDVVWDPVRPGVAYMVTADRFNSTSSVGRTRVWRFTFNDLVNPTGGTVEPILDGNEGCQMLDNVEVDSLGNLLLQEDTGGWSHRVRIWHYAVETDQLTLVAQSDPARFLLGGSLYITENEETSGIVSAAESMGSGWFLINVQAHAYTDAETVEGGQLLALYCPLSVPSGFNRQGPFTAQRAGWSQGCDPLKMK